MVACRLRIHTVEPSNKGHLGIRANVLYSEAVPYWEVYNFYLKNLFYNPESVFRHEMCEYTLIVSAHRRILGMASVVCVLVKICVSSISLYKLDTDKLTTPFESAHQFTLVCTVSDSKTVPGCHYNLCSNHSFVLTD